MREWCWERCLALQAWLRLRFSYDFFQDDWIEQGKTLSLWSICPQAQISFEIARAAWVLRSQPRVSTERARQLNLDMEVMMRRLFLLGGFNISIYLKPNTLSFAPFFHLAQFVQELRRYHEAAGQSGRTASYCRLDGDKRRPRQTAASLLHALERYLDDDTVPPKETEYYDFRPEADSIVELGGRCSFGVAAMLFAAADVQRLQLAAPDGGELVSSRLVLAGTDCFRCAIRAHGAPEGFIAHLATESCVPVLEVMDRLDRQVVVPMQLEGARPAWDGRPFHVHVLPTPNIESSHVRSFLKLHCDGAFMEFARKTWASSDLKSQFTFVEVGAHLGGCTLHVLTSLDEHVQGVAIEPYAPAAAALRRTAYANSLQDRLTVEERVICEDAGARYTHQRQVVQNARWMHQPGWVEHSAVAADAAASADTGTCKRLDDVLRNRGISAVDLMRIHVQGGELSVLRSAKAVLQAGTVRAVAVAIFGENMPAGQRQDAGAIARLLRGHGLVISYQGLSGDRAEALLDSDADRPDGTTTLLAELPDGGLRQAAVEVHASAPASVL